MDDSQHSDSQGIEIIDDPVIDASSVLVELKKLRRRNLIRFVAGLLLIVVPGAIWAATSKDPIRGFDNNQFFPDGPFFEEDVIVDFGFDGGSAEIIVPTTTIELDN